MRTPSIVIASISLSEASFTRSTMPNFSSSGQGKRVSAVDGYEGNSAMRSDNFLSVFESIRSRRPAA